MTQLLLSLAPHGAFRYVTPGCSWYEHHHLGGCQRPPIDAQCSATTADGSTGLSQRLGVIIPFRGTIGDGSFDALCASLPAHFERNSISFHILVVNQVDEHPFNRAALANAGFQILSNGGRHAGLRASDQRGFDCMAIHDVDRFPVTNDANRSCEAFTNYYYTCPSSTPRVLHPESFTGGVLLLRPSLFRAVNGFSNEFWGWGQEDNELYLRLRACGVPPEHPPELDSCMQHRDCERCKRAKLVRKTGLQALRAETRGIARVQGRMAKPLSHIQRDGLTTLNFTVGTPRPASVLCGRQKLHVLDVRLHRADSWTSPLSRSVSESIRRPRTTCEADGSERDDGCVAAVALDQLPSRLLSRARRALPHGVRLRRVVGATRSRAMYNFHYELDMEAEALHQSDSSRSAQSLFRVAVCAQEWQDRGIPDDVRYQLLWRAVAVSHRSRRAATTASRFKLTKNFSYNGHFPCTLHSLRSAVKSNA